MKYILLHVTHFVTIWLIYINRMMKRKGIQHLSRPYVLIP